MILVTVLGAFAAFMFSQAGLSAPPSKTANSALGLIFCHPLTEIPEGLLASCPAPVSSDFLDREGAICSKTPRAE